MSFEKITLPSGKSIELDYRDYQYIVEFIMRKIIRENVEYCIDTLVEECDIPEKRRDDYELIEKCSQHIYECKYDFDLFPDDLDYFYEVIRDYANHWD